MPAPAPAASVTVPVATVEKVFLISGQAYAPYVGEDADRPETAVQALHGNRLRWFVPRSFGDSE
jgi:hypothetical protein